MRVAILLAALALGTGQIRVEAQTCSFPDFYPLNIGHSWTYVNSTNSNDFYFWDVLGSFPYCGDPISVKVGFDANNALIASNDGATFVMYAYVDNGTVVDFPAKVPIGLFSDGEFVNTDPSQFIVIRKWENLDHTLTGAYGIDPTLSDLILLVYYDRNFSPGLQNPVVESGSGATSYPFGVTDICFLGKGRGPFALVGVDAATGNIDPRFDAIASFDCNGNQIPDHLDISFGISLDLNGDGIPDECGLGSAVFRNGVCATNPTGFVAAGPSLGMSWSASVDNTGTGNTFAQVVGYASPTDFCFSLGALLVNPADPAGELLGLLPAPGTGSVDFEATVPPNTSLIGLSVFTQGFGFTVGGGNLNVTLRNAYDLVIGY